MDIKDIEQNIWKKAPYRPSSESIDYEFNEPQRKDNKVLCSSSKLYIHSWFTY